MFKAPKQIKPLQKNNAKKPLVNPFLLDAKQTALIEEEQKVEDKKPEKPQVREKTQKEK